MREKTTFVLRLSYAHIFEDMDNENAGKLIKAVFAYVNTGKGFEELKEAELKMAAKFIKNDLDHDTQAYKKRCEQNAINGKKGGKNKGKIANANENSERYQTQTKIANANENSECKPIDCDCDCDCDCDVDTDNELLTSKPETAPACGVQEAQINAQEGPKLAQGAVFLENEGMDSHEQIKTQKKAKNKETEKKPRKLNKLQEFSNMVLARFEQITAPEQKAIWFKRNCRCLSDILNYALGDKDLACEMIACTCAFLKENRLTGGYEAVCRQLPRWYEEALKHKREKEVI